MIADSGRPPGRCRRRRPSPTHARPPALVREALAGSPRRPRRRRRRARPRRRLVVVDSRARVRRRARLRPTCAPRSPGPCSPLPTPRRWPACSTPAAPSTCRAPRCSPTAHCWPTSSRPLPWTRRWSPSDDVVLGVLPLFHVYGLNAVLGSVLRQGATLVLSRRLRPAGHPRPGRRPGRHGGARRTGRLPALARRSTTSARGWPSVRLVLSGSAPLARAGDRGVRSPDRHPRAPGLRADRGRPRRDQHALLGRPAARLARHGAPRRRPPARGRPRPEPESGDPGEIQVRGANLFSGYWPDGADGARSRRLVGHRRHRTPRRDGDLFLVDRVQEVVVVAGFSVYPHEVEAVIGQVPGVAEAAVIGVPDDATGARRRRLRTSPGTGARGRRGRPRPVRRGRWPASSGRPVSRWSTSCPTTLAGTGAQGRSCAGSSAAARWGCWSEREAARVVMYGRPGCHLCELAAEVIARVCDDLGETWVEVSIDDDPALLRGVRRGDPRDPRRRPPARLLARRRGAPAGGLSRHRVCRLGEVLTSGLGQTS